MWTMKEDVVPVAQLPTPKEPLNDIDESAPWSYEPLRPEQLRWYWNKQPFSLKGVPCTQFAMLLSRAS